MLQGVTSAMGVGSSEVLQSRTTHMLFAPLALVGLLNGAIPATRRCGQAVHRGGAGRLRWGHNDVAPPLGVLQVRNGSAVELLTPPGGRHYL